MPNSSTSKDVDEDTESLEGEWEALDSALEMNGKMPIHHWHRVVLKIFYSEVTRVRFWAYGMMCRKITSLPRLKDISFQKLER